MIVSDSGLYHLALQGFFEPEDANAALNETLFSFKIEKTGFITLDTSFYGRGLKSDKTSRSSYDVTFPDLYLIQDTTAQSNRFN